MRTNPALEALNRAVNRSIAEGYPVYVNHPPQFQPRNIKLELLPARDSSPIEFEGFEGLEFRLYKMDGLWAIAEASTGMPIVYGMDSKAHATDKATWTLAKHGPDKTRAVVAATLERIADKAVAA